MSFSELFRQITVTLKPGEVVTDQNITAERWLTFSLSVAGVLVCLYLIWMNSAAEAAITSLSRHRLQLLKERNERRGRLVDELLDRPAQIASSISVVLILALIIATALTISAIHQFNIYGWEVTALVLLLAFIILSLARALPKGYASRQPEKTALQVSGFINAEVFVARPLVWLVSRTSNLLLRISKVEPIPNDTVVSEEEMALLADIGEEEGLIEADERKMIRSIFQFGDTLVREVMVPRLDIKAVPSSAGLDEILDAIISSGKSRLPVYHPDIDHIQGILYAKDLLKYLHSGEHHPQFSLSGLLRPAYYVPESKKVDQLFAELQNQRVHIAIIVDEYGGTAGMVTIEDLLEEIVGEIQDEFDTEAADLERVGPDEILVDARLNLGDLNDALNTAWESEDIETIGGLVYDKLGRIPVEGDEIVLDRAGRLLVAKADGTAELDLTEHPSESPETVTDYFRVSVVTVSGQRLRQLRITRHQTDLPSGQAASASEEQRAPAVKTYDNTPAD